MSTSIMVIMAILLVLLALQGLFACMEAAFTSVNRVWLHEMAEQGDRHAKLAEKLLDNADSFFGTVLLGTNLLSVTITTLFSSFIALAILDSEWYIQLFAWFNLKPDGESFITALFVTPVTLLCCELVPKAIARAHSDAITLKLAGVLNFARVLLHPLLIPISYVSSRLTRLIATDKGGQPRSRVTRDDLRILATVAAEQGLIRNEARQIMTTALELESKTVGDVAVPLVEVKSLPLTAMVADVERLSADTGFTRFPVYDGRIDNIIGIISVRHCIYDHSMEGSDTSHKPIAPLVDRLALFVPEYKAVGALLDELSQSSSPMAIVVDEYGGMVGLVTIEDLVGMLLGGIQDLRNQHAFAILKAGEGIYECDGKANIHDLELTFGIPLPPNPEFETAAGLALTLFGRVPRTGASLHYRGWRIKVLEMANHRIARLRFTRTS